MRHTPHCSRTLQDTAADDTYRRLLAPAAWRRLHPDIRARFSVRPSHSGEILYRGTMYTVAASAAGRMFACACRLLGRPLTTRTGRDVPVTIRLSPDLASGGVTWLRYYGFRPCRPMVVRSTKVLREDGVLCEHIGRGFSMRMHLQERGGNLVFVSTAYCLTIGRVSLNIHRWLTPGTTTVMHEYLAPGRFRFTLSVDHDLLGRTFFQRGDFRDE